MPHLDGDYTGGALPAAFVWRNRVGRIAESLEHASAERAVFSTELTISR
jgi:hypothetical protein